MPFCCSWNLTVATQDQALTLLILQPPPSLVSWAHFDLSVLECACRCLCTHACASQRFVQKSRRPIQSSFSVASTLVVETGSPEPGACQFTQTSRAACPRGPLTPCPSAGTVGVWLLLAGLHWCWGSIAVLRFASLPRPTHRILNLLYSWSHLVGAR